MTISLLIVAAIAFQQADNVESLRVRVEISTNEVRLGDPVFVQVELENVGDTPTMAPCGFSREDATLRFVLVNGKGDSTVLRPDGVGFGGVKYELLRPGAKKIMYDCLLLPRLDLLDEPSWKPGGYDLVTEIRISKEQVLRASPRQLAIRERPAAERAALRNVFKLKDDEREFAMRGMFGLTLFPLREEGQSEKFEDLERILSKGGLLDAIRLTRLVRDFRRLERAAAKETSIREIHTLVRRFPPIQREWMSEQIVRFAISNKDRSLFELAEAFVALTPDEIGCAKNRREARRRFLAERLKPMAPAAEQ